MVGIFQCKSMILNDPKYRVYQWTVNILCIEASPGVILFAGQREPVGSKKDVE